MQSIKDFLKGKKTYIGAAGLALVAIIGWWVGAINGTVCSGMLAAAFGIAGLGAKGNRLAEVTMEALNEAKRVQQQRASGQSIDWSVERARILQIIQDAIKGSLPSQLSWSGTTAPVPIGANVAGGAAVTFNLEPSVKCMFCGLPLNANGGICMAVGNTSIPDTAGNRHHSYLLLEAAK